MTVDGAAPPTTGDDATRSARPAARDTARRTAVAALRLVRGSDVALVYVAVLVVVTVVLLVLGDRTYDRIVAESSTNLANLRERPLIVLLASAFVVSSPFGLWILPFLALVYATAQRWVGRAATIAVALLGHVGATLVVATELSAGIAHGYLSRHVVHATDVGVSYALVCLAAFVTVQVPRRWRRLYVGVLVVYVLLPLLLDLSFTDIGHLMALLLGGTLAFVAGRVAREVREA